MTDVVIKQMPSFKKAYKRLYTNQKQAVNAAIKSIVKNPELGQEKKGDLSSVFAYKFKIKQQLMLLAYQWDPKTLHY